MSELHCRYTDTPHNPPGNDHTCRGVCECFSMSTSQVVSRLPKSSLLLDLISHSSVYEFYHSDRGVSSIRTVSAVAASLRSIKPLASVPPRDAACFSCVHLQHLVDTVSESVEVHNYMYVAHSQGMGVVVEQKYSFSM